MTVGSFKIEMRLPQTLRIQVAGKDVACLDGNRGAQREWTEDAVPDVVALWTTAVNAGLLGGLSAPPADCAAVIETTSHPAALQQTWLLRVDRADWGAFRVLHNLLVALDLDQVFVDTVRGPDAPAVPERLDVQKVPFPRMPEALPFAVVRDQIVKRSKQRAVYVSLAEKTEKAIDALIEGLDLWGELIVRGGYAPPGMGARRSGAIPDGAILLDSRTVAQTFQEAFQCDEAAFEAVLSQAAAIARTASVAQVKIQ